jgi:6-pyruvoyltetrahydropterin/6-carboxytetrahydropterin synthase
MSLTVSKRLEFSASRRLFDPQLSAAENQARFGDESGARYGTGRNYVAYFIFSGSVDQATGMLMNIGEIKSRAKIVVDAGFDHKFLNEDNPSFAGVVPTAENVARQLWADAEPLFRDSAARLVACHLCETEERSATVFADGICEANYWFDFSAARATKSPHLSDAENAQLFGVASSPMGHGHHYRGRVTFREAQSESLPPPRAVRDLLQALRTELDHKNLNAEVPGLADRPITTESLAGYLFEKISRSLSVNRVRLHERQDFFAERWSDGRYSLAMQKPFEAAHRLQAPSLSLDENAELFGKCNNLRGHGHRYLAEATVAGVYDKRTGIVADFSRLESALTDSLAPWQDKHLDLETPEFRDTASTGENIVAALWPKVNSRLDGQLERLRLWETANNRFTLRREPI